MAVPQARAAVKFAKTEVVNPGVHNSAPLPGPGSVPQFLQTSYLRFFRGRTHGFTTRVHYPNSCKKHGSGRP